MSRQERYGTRDLSYSAWHRRLDDDLTYIDIDACEYCRRCRQPLALIETAKDVGQQFKATPVIRKLAALANLPAYLVLYRVNGESVEAFRIKKLVPTFTDWIPFTPAAFADVLWSLRANHNCAERERQEARP